MSERAEKAWTLLKELLRVDTTNPPGRESAAVEVLGRFLKSEGVAFTEVEKEKGRANLVARIKGEKPGLVLVAHLDVVPAEAEKWTHPPFEGVEADGYLWGRGSIDMKHMAAMSAVVLAEASRRKLTRGLALAAVADEEAGCAAGSRFLVEKHPELVAAEAMLGEGGGFTQYAGRAKFCPIAAAEKGQLIVRLSFKGRAGHASIPHPENPAFKAAAGLHRLRPGRLPVHATRTTARFLEGLAALEGGVRGWGMRALTLPDLAPTVLRFLPVDLASSLRAMLSHSVSPTIFEGSKAINVIPDTVTVKLDVRTLPGFRPDEVLAELWDAVGEEIDHEILEWSPPVESSLSAPLFEHLGKTVRRHDPSCAPLPFMIPGFTDAKQFSRLGMDCYGFAPLLLDPQDAADFRFRVHGVDERVAKEAFLRGYSMLEDAVLSYIE